MTCIIGYLEKDKIWMAGDRVAADTGQWQKQVINEPKVFRIGSFIMGYTSSFRFGDLLKYSFKPTEPHPDDDLSSFMRWSFVVELRKLLRDEGYSRIDSNQESGGTMLVGIGDRLFMIQDDFAVIEYSSQYAAIGCGAPYALGALMAVDRFDLEPSERLDIAMQAASSLSAFVSNEYDVISL